MSFCTSLCGCCDQPNKRIIYVMGSKENKNLFLSEILNLKPSEDQFHEYETRHGGLKIIIHTCELTEDLNDISDLHTKMASGLIYISERDEIVEYEKPTLFVLINKHSKQENDKKKIVTTMGRNSYEECKEGFDKFVEMISGK